MLRFAVLVHDHPHLHWDFLVEFSPEDALKTWRLAEPPHEGASIDAEALPDHRRIYLDYEGPVSGNRGEVKRWDRGEVEVLSETACEIVLRLRGERLNGTARITHSKERDWRFEYTACGGDVVPAAEG